MSQLFTKLILVVSIAVALVFAASPVAFAANCPSSNDAKGQVLNGIGETGSNCDSSSIYTTIKTAVNVLSFLAGAIAVIMIIISGIKFVTSGGDSAAVSSAKNTLIYAIIGLAVVALAQVIVHFVLNAIINNTVNPKG